MEQQYGGQPTQQPMQQQPMYHHQQHTTVVVQQPQGLSIQKPPARGWNEGLFGCFSDMGTCCFAWFCPACFQCHLASKAGESCCLPCCLPDAWLITLRVKHRTSHNIQGSVLQDCCVVCCCGPCAGCQLAREIDKYGN